MRQIGELREIVEAVLFLASDEASFVTGMTLRIAGGRWRHEIDCPKSTALKSTALEGRNCARDTRRQSNLPSREARKPHGDIGY